MPSHAEAGLRARAALLGALALGALLPSRAATPVSAPAAPTPAEIRAAAAEVAKDPNLATTKKMRNLEWVDEEQERQRESPGFLKWLAEFFAWLAGAARWLLYLVLAILIAVLVVLVVRFAGNARRWESAASGALPTHVRELDIRPESLPDDIGAAARSLWDRGEHRAALALLYRGMLSRLVHVHAVPIRQSSTEGDCLELAALRLDGARLQYVATLVRTWQRSVYGGRMPESAVVHDLCGGFDAALGGVVSTAPGGAAAAVAT